MEPPNFKQIDNSAPPFGIVVALNPADPDFLSAVAFPDMPLM